MEFLKDNFEKGSLLERIRLFIFLRWLSVIGLTIIILVNKYFFGFFVDITPVVIILFICALYNFAFGYFERRETKKEGKGDDLKHLAMFQISYDSLFFILIIHFTGGIESPFLVYFVFHIIVSCIILPTTAIYLQTTTTALLMSAVVLLEKNSLLPHISMVDYSRYKPFESINYILLGLTIFVGTIYLSVYLVSHFSNKVQMQQKELDVKTFDLSTAKLALEGSYLDSVIALVKAVEAKDNYTQGHSKRVTKYIKEIAKRLGSDNQELEVLEFAGLLHDIGKIGVRESVLRKNGPLTPEEYEEIKMHSVIGYRIIEFVKFLERIRPAILYHHEKFDGTGYPSGLAGEQIPLIARIIAVADAYDAMKSERPYRQSLSSEETIQRLIQGKGSQFDPYIVDVFLKMLEEDKVT